MGRCNKIKRKEHLPIETLVWGWDELPLPAHISSRVLGQRKSWSRKGKQAQAAVQSQVLNVFKELLLVPRLEGTELTKPR